MTHAPEALLSTNKSILQLHAPLYVAIYALTGITSSGIECNQQKQNHNSDSAANLSRSFAGRILADRLNNTSARK
jgi:hypothetical protein